MIAGLVFGFRTPVVILTMLATLVLHPRVTWIIHPQDRKIVRKPLNK